MARFDVASFTTATTATTVGPSTGTEPFAPQFSLSASTGAPDTTFGGLAGFSVGLNGAGIPHTLGYAAWVQNTSQKSASSLSTVNDAKVLTTAGTSLGSPIVVSGTTMVKQTSGFPAAVAVIRGDGNAQLTIGNSPVPISTVASTQATTVGSWGVITTNPPNVLLLIGASEGSSVANASFGIACKTTAGVINQWSIDQTAREGNPNGNRSASTASILKLHTSASTAHDVSVTSFKTSGAELTVNATDTARAATMMGLHLYVPRSAAGKATITTDGVGVGQTGINVTGLGPNVGLVFLASIGSSLQTLQASNAWSIGFASSNGNQRSVSGFVNNNAGGNSLSLVSYFNSTRAVTFTTATTAGGAGGSRISQGLFAVTTDGFSLTMDNTVANGWDIYWAALSNVVADIEAHINSSGAFNANVIEVSRLAAAITGELGLSADLDPEFEVGTGKHFAKAKMQTHISQDGSMGLGFGTEKIDDRFLVVTENSSSPDLSRDIDVTTTPQRIGMAGYTNAKFVQIIPPSSNTHPYRIAGSLQSDGVPVSSRGTQTFTVSDVGSDMYLKTTVAGSTIHKMRVRIL